MGEPETVSPIQQLPFEVMCHIFDYLDIRSVKNCSLTCRRWLAIIFSDSYIKRFQLSLRSYLCNFIMVEQSDRLYRHVKITWHSNDFHAAYNVLSYPKVKQYVTLELEITGQAQLNMLCMVTDAVKRMKVLRELHLHNNNCTGSTILLDRHILSNTLQLLNLRYVLPAVIKTPNLTTLTLKLNHEADKYRLYSYRFPRLKSLELCGPAFVETKHVKHALSFITHLTELETIVLSGTILYGYILKAICESCISLTKLDIESMCIADKSIVCNLSKLTKLRELRFGKIDCLEPVSFLNVNLPHLDVLGIGDFLMNYDSLKVFRSATKIALLMVNIPTEVISTIVNEMPKIRQLELKYESSLVAIQLLPSVEVLEIEICCITSLNLPLLYKSSNIKELYCPSTKRKPSDYIIAKLLKVFPNLQILRYGNNWKHRIIENRNQIK